LIEPIVPVVFPVVRPLFSTASPIVGVLTTLLIVPIASMKPVESIVPLRRAATAQSTLLPSIGAVVKSATMVAG
jgi:hypothetical protein